MQYSYDESYLSEVQKNLGFFFQFLLHNLAFSPKNAQTIFLSSIIPAQIEQANPDFLCGKSGFELTLLALGQKAESNIMTKIYEAIKEPFFPEAEYWSGYILAYCQWQHSIPFSTILKNYPLERILNSYHLLHEADITKADSVIMSFLK